MTKLTEVFTTEPGVMLGDPAILLRRRDGHVIGYRRTHAEQLREYDRQRALTEHRRAIVAAARKRYAEKTPRKI